MDNRCGQHWILLRGLARESAHWGNFVPQLQASFPSATITALDLPGTGRFFQQSGPNRIPAIAEQVRTNAHEQGLPGQPVMILAVSLGAMVAWEWLQRYPGDSCGAVFINTSFASLSPFYQRLRWQSYLKLFALPGHRDIYQRELEIVKLVSNQEKHYEEFAKDWANIQIARPLSLRNTINQLVAAATYRPAKAKPKTPVLLLNSKSDRLVSPVCSEAIQKQWNLDLRTHPWAGHDLTLDDGAWVIAQLQQWMANQHSSFG
ncbi:MAG: alpha/beta hydrolase [Methylovulum sp.]|uniref:alpha/beta fold hydrolase n=1 Tax=Methylovulum sp. TaxID=1916980 RepID=UPI0026185EBF|nr:alpha/beta hydrolase [Methylovulum sp.]MDD2724452.1 alpha/beta hydrolase [Methylovulum sp.]MDD5123669.1 alpha/beta hydrolase [Methylovulum sp.]